MENSKAFLVTMLNILGNARFKVPHRARDPRQRRRKRKTMAQSGATRKCCKRHGKTPPMGLRYCAPQRHKTQKRMRRSSSRAKCLKALLAEFQNKTRIGPCQLKDAPSMTCGAGTLRNPAIEPRLGKASGSAPKILGVVILSLVMVFGWAGAPREFVAWATAAQKHHGPAFNDNAPYTNRWLMDDGVGGHSNVTLLGRHG